MNEVKAAFIEALEKSGNALHAIVGDHTLPGPFDVEGQRRLMNDRNHSAKWQLVIPKDVIRGRVEKLKRDKGEWPQFRSIDAAETLETIEQIEAVARIRTRDADFNAAISEALQPLREVVERYGTETPDGWRFPDDSADVVSLFPDPPPAGT